MAQRITEAFDEAGLTSVAVAEFCGVTPQAVNGWKTTGRIGKDQLPKLVALTGRPLQFWLGADAEVAPKSAASEAMERLERAMHGKSQAEITRIVDAVEVLLRGGKATSRPAGTRIEFDTTTPTAPPTARPKKS